MDSHQTAHNYFFPQWMSEQSLVEGNLIQKVYSDKTLIVKEDYYKRYGRNGRAGHYNDGVSNARQNRHEKSSVQANGVLNELPNAENSKHKNITPADKNSTPNDSLRHTRRGSAGVLNECDSDKKLEITKSSKAYVSLDEEFPTLNGEVIADNPKTASSKMTSVWDGTNHDSTTASRNSNSACEPAIKASGPMLNMNTPPTVTKTKIAQQATPSGKASSGRRTLTVLSSGIVNGRHRENAALKSVGKVVTQELENRKSNYMKLVRRDSRESSSDVSHTESCSQTTDTPTASTVGCTEHKVSKTWAAVVQNSTDTDESVDSASAIDSGSCTPPKMFYDVCDTSSEAERKLLIDMGWNENDQTDELTADEVFKFVRSCPDFSKKWELVIDYNADKTGIINFLLIKRNPIDG